MAKAVATCEEHQFRGLVRSYPDGVSTYDDCSVCGTRDVLTVLNDETGEYTCRRETVDGRLIKIIE